MRPEFGAGLQDFVFDTINSNTLGRIQAAARKALIQWEPRIELLNLGVTADPGEIGRVLIHIGWRVRATNNRFNLVFPFYLQQGIRTMIERFPPLDERGLEQILSQALERVPYYLPEWEAGDRDDPGTALLHAFAGLMEGSIQRFNRVPEKNLIAFLNMLGIELIPPRPATPQVSSPPDRRKPATRMGIRPQALPFRPLLPAGIDRGGGSRGRTVHDPDRGRPIRQEGKDPTDRPRRAGRRPHAAPRPDLQRRTQNHCLKCLYSAISLRLCASA